jgi:hypothetical protein
MPSSSRAFQDTKNMKHPSSVDLITTKQNKLQSFMDRFLCKGTKVFLPCIENSFARQRVLQVATLPKKKEKKGRWLLVCIIYHKCNEMLSLSTSKHYFSSL